MLHTDNPEDAVRLLPDHELHSIIERCTEAINSARANIQEYELYVLAVFEGQQCKPLVSK
jgi:hypothetical protein